MSKSSLHPDSVARGLWCNPPRIGITMFKARPNFISIVYRSGIGRRTLCVLVDEESGFMILVNKRLVRYCTDDEVAAFALGWRAENAKFISRYNQSIGKRLILRK